MTTSENDTQDTPLHGPNLILDVENFGPIAEAKNIEFKPMTVFLGPSNTGKTYLATLLYAISRGLDDAQDWLNSIKIESLSKHMSILRTGLRKMDFDDERLSEKLPHHPGKDLIAYYRVESPEELQHTVDFLHSDWLNFASGAINDSITDYFQVRHINDLANRQNNSDIEIRFELHRHDHHSNWKIEYGNGRLEAEASPWPLVLPKSIALDFVRSDERETVLRSPSARQFMFSVSSSFVNQVSGPDYMAYFPAARSGILASHRSLNLNLVSNASRSRSERELMVPNNRIVIDFLENLLLIHPQVLNPDQRVARLAEIIENSLMGGEIKAIDSQYGPPEFVYSQGWGDIPFTRSSSMVNELAPIVLSLKHHLGIKRILVIEEPEAHLHPTAQQRFAAALALLVRSGFRVLITTHSHYMVEQLSAFVNASKLDETTRKRALSLGGALGKEDIYLNEEETAVYNFRFSPEHGGSVVKEVLMGDEYEYGTDDHSDATVDQFNRLQRVLEAREAAESNGVD